MAIGPPRDVFASAGNSSGKTVSITAGTGITVTPTPITSAGVVSLQIPVTVTHGGTGTTTAFTQGSVVFAGASGVYSQDNSKFFWDDAGESFVLGVTSGAAYAGNEFTLTAKTGNTAMVLYSNAADGALVIQDRTWASTPVQLSQGIDGKGYLSSPSTMECYGNFEFLTGYAVGPLRDKGGAVFNVTAYGAVGDGTTDDTAAIQAAITAAAAITPRGRVYLPAGKYKVTSGFNLTGLEGLSIVGTGPDSSIFYIANATMTLFTVSTGTAYLELSNFSVDSPSTTRTAGWVMDFGTTYPGSGLVRSRICDIEMIRQNNGIRVQLYSFVWIDRCMFRWGTGAAESATPGKAFKVGLAAHPSAEIYFAGCQVLGQNDAFNRTGPNLGPDIGFEIEDTAAVYMANCGATYCLSNSLNVISNQTTGTYTQNLFFQNFISDGTYSGDSTLISGTGYLEQVQFTGCWFASGGAIGGNGAQAGLKISLPQFNDILLTGCIVAGNCGNGVSLTASTDLGQAVISGCSFRGNGAFGGSGNNNAIFYSVPSTKLGPTISGNQETGSTGNSVQCPSSKTLRASITGNGWTTAMTLGSTPSVLANNGPI